jgi:dextranase
VIFAFGGSHLELGEHMLAKEYFPNNNLQVSGQLRSALIAYYDFLVAYQNLLRDGGEINQPEVNSDNSQVNIGSWPPEAGKIAVVGRLIESAQIINLINFNNVSSMLWRDTNGDQLEPVEVKNLYLKFKTSRQVEQVWIASPDLNFGLPQSVNFSSLPDGVEIDVPYLKYWDMIVVEYQ